jgi:hypothetical protein
MPKLLSNTVKIFVVVNVIISKTIRDNYKIPAGWSSSCYWQYTVKKLLTSNVKEVNSVRKTEKCKMLILYLCYFLQQRKKIGIHFGNYQPLRNFQQYWKKKVARQLTG